MIVVRSIFGFFYRVHIFALLFTSTKFLCFIILNGNCYYVGTLGNPRILPFPGNSQKVIQAWHAFPGVILYEVNQTSPLPDPVPVVLPEDVMKRIARFIERTVSTGVDAETAIRLFFDSLTPYERELLKQYAISAGIAVVVATLIEDLFSGGFGILDDPASFYLAYRLIAFAI